MLKDFKSFLIESRSGDTWEHSNVDNEFYGVRSKDKHPAPTLSKDHERGRISLSYDPSESSDAPYHVSHFDRNTGEDIASGNFSKLNDALNHMKKQGHPVPDHHVTMFKSEALKHATSKNDK